ncbi:protein translocase subunit SecF [Candidatus Woesearchaeota archaeon]|nr:protein translocase subunit SecF [Candidatus Woesearchaeota archaeon]RLE40668.1 MAG: protein translocase subunit SecF [Candidatus Woesearchaeota archaeon]
MGIRALYEKHYKKLMIIPFLLLLFAIIQIAYQTVTTGDFIHKGVSLKGGVTITIQKPISVHELELFLKKKFPKADIQIRALSKAGKQTATIIEASDINPEQLQSALKENLGNDVEFSTEVMGSALGESFFKQTTKALIFAFIFMAIVVFFYFKTFTPSIAVILAAVSDIIVTLAIVNLLGIRLSTAGIAAFLMLIGYSVDTDILLSTKTLRRKENPVQGIYAAMKTGLMMTATTLTAVTIALILAQSPVLKQIMTILLIGLLVDLPNTWLQNAGILRIYLERKKKKWER